MNIHSCKGCLRAGRDSKSPCTQKDDMEQIYSAFVDCDVVVFASPVYFWMITGTLKTVADRLYAKLECLGYGKFARESVLLMTADGSDYSQAVTCIVPMSVILVGKTGEKFLEKAKRKRHINLVLLCKIH